MKFSRAISLTTDAARPVVCHSVKDVVAALQPLIRQLRAGADAVRQSEEGLAQTKLALGKALWQAREELRQLGLAREWSGMLRIEVLGMHRKTVEGLIAAAVGLAGGLDAARRRRLDEMTDPEREYWQSHPLFDMTNQQVSHKGLMRIVGAQPLPGLRYRGENGIPTPQAIEEHSDVGDGDTDVDVSEKLRPGAQVLVDKSAELSASFLPPAASVGGGTSPAEPGRVGRPGPQAEAMAASAPTSPRPVTVQLTLAPLYASARRAVDDFNAVVLRVLAGDMGDEAARVLVSAIPDLVARITRLGTSAAHRATVKPGAEIEHATAL